MSTPAYSMSTPAIKLLVVFLVWAWGFGLTIEYIPPNWFTVPLLVVWLVVGMAIIVDIMADLSA